MSIFLVVLKTIGDLLFDDVGPCVDDQLQLGVLLRVLPVSTLSSSFTVSTSMFSKRLMICANSGDLVGAELGNLVLEHSDDLGLEGPCVGGQSRLGVQRCLGSLLNLGPHVSLHVKILGEVNSWR